MGERDVYAGAKTPTPNVVPCIQALGYMRLAFTPCPVREFDCQHEPATKFSRLLFACRAADHRFGCASARASAVVSSPGPASLRLCYHGRWQRHGCRSREAQGFLPAVRWAWPFRNARTSHARRDSRGEQQRRLHLGSQYPRQPNHLAHSRRPAALRHRFFTEWQSHLHHHFRERHASCD